MSPEIHSHVARNFYRVYKLEEKLAFEFVFKGRVSLGQPTRPRVL